MVAPVCACMNVYIQYIYNNLVLASMQNIYKKNKEAKYLEKIKKQIKLLLLYCIRLYVYSLCLSFMGSWRLCTLIHGRMYT